MALCLKGRICVSFSRSIRWNQMRFLKGHLVTRKSLQFESAQKFRHSRGFHISVSNCLADKKLPEDEITGQAKPSSSDESNNSSSESSDSSDSSDEEGRMKTPENRLDGRPKEAGNQNIFTTFKIEKKVYHLAIKNKIQSLQDEFNVKISFIYDRKASNIGKLFIKGPDKHCVFKAKKEIEKMKRLVPDSLVEEFSIPEPAVKHVIGTAGRNLKKLGEKYGIVIDVVDNKVSLLGNDSAILQDAKTEILKLCEENSEETKLDGRPKEAEKQDIFTTFRLEENVYNLVIKNKIQSLQDEFNVKISFAYDRNISNTGILVIKGPNKNFVLQAKKEIKYMMHLVPSRSMEQIEHSEQTSVPEHILKHVIGSEGRKINALQNKFEVAINIADNGNIRVFGKDPEKVKSAIQEIEEISKSSFSVETSVYPFVVTMESPVDKLKHVIGAGGKNLRQLKSKYDVDINVQNSGQITVRGVNEEVVNKVVEELINTIESASDMDCVYPFVVTMESPVDKIKHVIGAGGKNLKQLKSKYDVDIKVQKKTGQITVRGVDEEVVNKVVEELNNTIESASDMDGVYPFVVTMESPVDKIKHVIGAGGKNLKQLKSKYDVDIKVQKKTGQITVRGVDEEVVNKVVEELNNTIESASDMDGVYPFVVTMESPVDKIKHVIGAGGKNLKQLKSKYDVDVDVQNKTGQITVRGVDEEVVNKVVEEINNTIESASDMDGVYPFVVTMESPVDKIKHVIGAGGKNLKQLKSKYDVDVDVQNKTGQITVRGVDEEVVNKVVEEINNTIESASDMDGVYPFVVTMESPVDKIKHVIGAGGKNLKQLKSKYDVDVDVQNKTGQITVRGVDEEVVNKVVEEINNTIESASDMDGVYPFVVTMESPVDKMKHVIGAGGKNLKQLKSKYDVDVDLQKKTGQITVRGVDEEVVNKVVEEINNTIESASDMEGDYPFVVTMESPVDKIKHVIGAGGKNLKQLMSKYDVDIYVQKTGQITVRGVDEEVVNKVVEELNNTIESASDMDGKPDRSVYPFVVTMEAPVDRMKHVVGTGGKNLNKLTSKYDVDIDVQNSGQITVRGVDEEVVNKVVEELNNTIESASDMDGELSFPIVSKRIPFEEVDYKASFEKWSDFFNKGQPLGIFTEEDVAKMNETEQPVFHSKLWDEYQQEVALAEEKASVYNAFQEDIIKTKEGKLWQFPINNDQDWKEEENVSFADHVFLEQYLDEFPNKGPIRHFMELVTVGLSKNPYLTVKQKQEHIEWYKDYFRKHEGVLKDILGEGAQFGQNTDSK